MDVDLLNDLSNDPNCHEIQTVLAVTNKKPKKEKKRSKRDSKTTNANKRKRTTSTGKPLSCLSLVIHSSPDIAGWRKVVPNTTRKSF